MYQNFMKSSPTSYARTGLCKCTLGSPGMAPKRTSSMLGWVAAVTETESPSQPRPAVIHRICTSATGDGLCVDRPYGTVSAAIAGFSFSDFVDVKDGGRRLVNLRTATTLLAEARCQPRSFHAGKRR